MLRLEEARELATHTLLVREEIEILLSLVKDAETGQRGYLLTGEASYLEPYENAIRLLPTHTARLRTLTADNSGQQSQLLRLDGLIGAKLSEIATTIRARDTEGPAAASRIVRTDVGMRTMDSIRALLSVMRDEESRLYAAREIQMQGAARMATAVNIAGLACGVRAGARRHRADHPGASPPGPRARAAADIRGRRRGQPGVRGPAAHHAGEHRRRRDRHRRRGPRDPDEPGGAGADRLDRRRRARPADRGSLRHRQRDDPPAGGEPGDEGPARGHDRLVSPATRSSWPAMAGRSPSPTARRRSRCRARACRAWSWSSAT